MSPHGIRRRSAPARVVVLAVVVLLSVLIAGCSGAEGGRKAQDRLPSVTLDALEGPGSLDLSTLRGPAVVNLWASWCAPCKEELPDYQAFAARHAGRVKVVGIDFQDTRTSAAVALAKQTGVQYPLYADPDGRLRAQALPQLVLVDADGRITHREYVKITSVGQLEQIVEQHLPGALS